MREELRGSGGLGMKSVNCVNRFLILVELHRGELDLGSGGARMEKVEEGWRAHKTLRKPRRAGGLVEKGPGQATAAAGLAEGELLCGERG